MPPHDVVIVFSLIRRTAITLQEVVATPPHQSSSPRSTTLPSRMRQNTIPVNADVFLTNRGCRKVKSYSPTELFPDSRTTSPGTNPQRPGPPRNTPVRLVTFSSPKGCLVHTLGS